MHRTLNSLALVALTILAAAALAPPVAALARPNRPEPLYSVTLNGSTSLDQSEAREGELPPYGCKGSSTESLHYSASTQFHAVAARVPLAKYGRFRFFAFKVKLNGLAATDSSDTAGHWELDPTLPFLPDPSVCVFAAKHTDSHCTFGPAATSPQGLDFSLFPNPQDNGRFTLSHGDGIVEDCLPPTLPAPDLLEPVLTKLSVGKVLALGKGHSLSESITVNRPAPPQSLGGEIPGSDKGTETVSFKLQIKRVR